MIALALIAALVVLPSVLLMVTKEPERLSKEPADLDEKVLVTVG